MAYLMVKYLDPTTYALLDLSTVEMDVLASALNSQADLYERMGATDEQMAPIRTLSAALARRWGDDDDDEES